MMKLKLTEKKIEETEKSEDLDSHRFSIEELDDRIHELNMKMHEIAVPLQEKVPLQVAQHYFQIFGTSREKLRISKFVDTNGLVRLADIFIVGKLYNNINLDWHLNKYNKG